MEKEMKKDLRVEKTTDLIIETFKKLLYKKDYEDITIKELTEKAKINKSTFYRHYRSLDDLLSILQAEISHEFMQRIDNYKIPEQLAEINREFFLFSESKDKIYEKMIFNKNYEYMKQKTINIVMDKVWRASDFFKKLSPDRKNIFLIYDKLQE
ncbi:TetR/AcrR family transcriptional regulator [Streptococcus ratti]|uniref:TetR/AcrR family transcriptional regulator n=1 Tax=Streptococcus ratti TaxID=1341 RepID=A0A7X9LEC5_STRRT|nr:TetR/AcrR family transcriptional regulator [Streptococcus ratti]NMD49701.1 TetR/AcrR family transcriptional regulator [Streptococcus ratti]